MLPLTDGIRPSGWSSVLIGVEIKTYRLFDLLDECHLKVAVYVLAREAKQPGGNALHQGQSAASGSLQPRSHVRQHDTKSTGH